jgi:hypothetical protein
MVAVCFGGLSLAGKGRNKGLIRAAFAGFLLTLSPELMGGRFIGKEKAADFAYYFLPLSASIVVLLFAVAAYSEEVIPRTRAAWFIYGVLLCSSPGYTAVQHAAHLQRRDQDPIWTAPEMNYLREHRPGNYQLYFIQNEDYIGAYYDFRILAPSRWIYQHFWVWYSDWDGDGRLLRSIGDDLLRHHTTYVIMDSVVPYQFRKAANRDWWLAFMHTYYEQVPLPGRAQGKSMLWRLKLIQPEGSSAANPLVRPFGSAAFIYRVVFEEEHIFPGGRLFEEGLLFLQGCQGKHIIGHHIRKGHMTHGRQEVGHEYQSLPFIL